MIKKLLLLALIAVAREAMAEDAQCVRERAAMVETIRAYARVLGQQSISESVVEAVGRERNVIGSSPRVPARPHTRKRIVRHHSRANCRRDKAAAG